MKMQITLFMLLAVFSVCAYAEQVVVVEKKSIPKFYFAPGYIVPLNKIEITSKHTGYIKEIHIDSGDIVEKNQTLLVIDESAVNQSIEQIKKEIEILTATVFDLQKDVHSFKQLKQTQSISDEKFRKAQLLLIQAKGNLLKAQSQLIERQADLPYLRITSPEKALITERLVDIGDLATPGKQLLKLEVIKPILFETSVPVQWLHSLSLSQHVTIKLDTKTNGTDEITGQISHLVRSADPITQKCLVKIKINEPANLPSGLSGHALLKVTEESLLTIPEQALIKKLGISGVYRIDLKNQVWFTPVRYGRKHAGQQVILAGLHENDKVILSPSEWLRDGMTITHTSQ